MKCRGGRPSSAPAPLCVLGGRVWGQGGCGTWGHGLEVNVAVLGNDGTFPAQQFQGRLAWTCWGLCWLSPGGFQSLGKSLQHLPQTRTWTLLKCLHTPTAGFLLNPPTQGIRIPCRIFVLRPGRAGGSSCLISSLGSSGCSSFLCFPAGNGDLPWLSTFPFNLALMRQWQNTKQLLCLLQINKTGTNYVHFHFPCFLYKNTN